MSFFFDPCFFPTFFFRIFFFDALSTKRERKVFFFASLLALPSLRSSFSGL